MKQSIAKNKTSKNSEIIKKRKKDVPLKINGSFEEVLKISIKDSPRIKKEN